MNTYCGLDLGVKSSAFCMVDGKGKLIAEAEVPTDENCFERAFGGKMI
jgi:predicted NBD/HSP70 family sugar kinase